jgi:hypothetical protein
VSVSRRSLGGRRQESKAVCPAEPLAASSDSGTERVLITLDEHSSHLGKLGRLRPPFLSRQPCARNLPVRFGGLPLLPRLNHAAPYSFGVPNREDIAMARTAPEKSNFFVRCNYNVGAPGEAQKAAVRQEQSVKAATQKALALRYATDGLLALIESASRGLSKETKRRLRYANCGHLSWKSKPFARATLESGWLCRTSMRLPPHFQQTPAWWILDGGGCSRRPSCA